MTRTRNLLLLILALMTFLPSIAAAVAYGLRLEEILEDAVERGDVENVKKYLEDDYLHVNSPRFQPTLLYRASASGYAEVVKVLLEAGANMNEIKYNTIAGDAPIQVASRNGHAEVVKILLEAGANVDSDERVLLDSLPYEKTGRTPLFLASGNGRVEVVKVLLEAGANVNTKDKDNGWTPLHLASGNGRVEVVKVLLSAGADVNAKEKPFGHTPLQMNYGSRYRNAEVVNLLVAAAAVKILKDPGGIMTRPSL